MKQNYKYITKSVEQTQKLGEKLAKEILKAGLGKTAVVLALQGELGAGKTTFLQGFARGLGIKEKILSPTFILMKKFEIRNPNFETNPKSKILNSKFSHFYHVDCYRLKDEKDLEVLGFDKIISNPENIVAIEWPEKIEDILPKNIISIKFKHLEENIRELIITI